MQGLSINHYLAPPGYPVPQFLDDVVRLGGIGIGLTERALDEVPLPSLKRMLRERDLRVTSVNSAGFFLWGDPDRAGRQAAVNAWLIECAAELSADTLVLIGGGLHDMGAADDPGGLKAARSRVEAELPALIEAAATSGVRLGIEPMHPLRIFTKAGLNTLSQTEALLRRHPDLGFVLDLFHSWWDPDLEPILERMSDRLTLVQVCGVTQPRSEPALPKRCAIGEGVVDLASILDVLRRAGYRGRFEFELFAPDLDGRSVPEVMRRAILDFERAARGAAVAGAREGS